MCGVEAGPKHSSNKLKQARTNIEKYKQTLGPNTNVDNCSNTVHQCVTVTMSVTMCQNCFVTLMELSFVNASLLAFAN